MNENEHGPAAVLPPPTATARAQANAAARGSASRRRWLAVASAVGLCGGLVGDPQPVRGAELVVEVRLPDGTTVAGARPEARYTGELYLFLSRRVERPIEGPNWFAPEPFYRLDVAGWRPGESRRFDAASAVGYPVPLNALPAGEYRVQAVLDLWPDFAHHARGPGNLASPAASVTLAEGPPQALTLELTERIERRPLPETAWLRPRSIASRLLSEHHGRPVEEPLAVVLPAGYDEHPERRYPTVYLIPGFGGGPEAALPYLRAPPQPGPDEVDLIRVFLSGQSSWGHHVFADSPANGPRGAALVREVIPAIDAEFRTVADPAARFVAGHSSGGWSSLWLQVTYPDVFGGVWSTAPDPVDFRDFQGVDIYAPGANIYRDPAGGRRPLARRGGETALWFDGFTRLDDTLGRGGQLRSFEAVFSPLGADGQPRRLWDRATGQVDPDVAAAWTRFDITATLRNRWAELGPQLAGKLHIRVGSEDTFLLDGAVKRLAAVLRELGSDAEVTIVPGADHSNVITPEYLAESRRQMSAQFLRRFDREGQPLSRGGR